MARNNKSFTERVARKLAAVRSGARKYLLHKIIGPLAYKFYSLKPVEDDLVVFVDNRDRNMPENFQPLYDMCKEAGFRVEFLTRKGKERGKSPAEVNKGKMEFMFDFYKKFATARAVFLVEYMSYAYTVKPRKGTDLVQLWHACGMIKCISYAAYGTKWSSSTLSDKAIARYPMHHTYSVVAASSPRLCKYYQRAFRCDEKVTQPLGSPRTDVFYDETFKKRAMKKLRKRLPEIGDRKIIIYAPTFRGTSMASSFFEGDLDYKLMTERLSDKYVFLTKFHPLLANGGLKEADRIRAKGFVYDISKMLSPEEACCVADILISDYSSILYDYMLMERPIISYIYDLDEYISDRGIMDPYEELVPGPYTFNTEELVEALETVDEWFDIERMRAYRKEFMGACDGHSTERIFNYVFSADEVARLPKRD